MSVYDFHQPGVPDIGFDADAEERWHDEQIASRANSNGKVCTTVQTPRRTSWNAVDLMDHTFAAMCWAVFGIIAEGLTLLVRPPKLGKSWFALNIAVAIAAGGKALGGIGVDCGDVLYLALEDPPRRLQARLQKILAGSVASARLDFATECEPMPAAIDRIRAWLVAHPDARLVVVDVWARIRGRMNDRASMYEQDYLAMSTLKALADEFSVAFLVVHHTRKGGDDDFLQTVSGTNGLAGAADAVLVLSRSRGSAQAVLKVTGRDIEEAEYALDFAADIGTWKMLDGPASDYETSEQRRKILAAVRESAGIGPKQISEASGVAHDVVKHLVRKMVDDDQLDTDGAGHYFTVHSIHPVHSETGNGEHGEQSEGADE